MSEQNFRKGRVSDHDRRYILANRSKCSVEELSQYLNRSPAAIKRVLNENPPHPLEKTLEQQFEAMQERREKAEKRQERREQKERKERPVPNSRPVDLEEDQERFQIREELKASEGWRLLKEEFTEKELRFFEESYVKLMKQFRGDVLATEETQVFQAVKYEILMSRNLQARKVALEDIVRLDAMQREFLGRFGGDISQMTDADKTFSLNLENQLQTAKAAEQSRTTEYTKLQERHDGLMKGLKATRDQRVKQIESAKTNFLGVIKMLQDKDRQDTEGRQIELTRLAAEKEYERLGRPIRYDDGEMDSPILSADTVDLGPEDEDGEEDA